MRKLQVRGLSYSQTLLTSRLQTMRTRRVFEHNLIRRQLAQTSVDCEDSPPPKSPVRMISVVYSEELLRQRLHTTTG